MAGTVLHAEGMKMKAGTWLSVDYLHRLLFPGAHVLTLTDTQGLHCGYILVHAILHTHALTQSRFP